MPFESEEGDLQKLNIIVWFVFLSLKSLYVVPFLLILKKTLYFYFFCIANGSKNVENNEKLSKLCLLKVKRVICKN